MKKGGETQSIDRYIIISTLSSHPHSTVWLAEHRSLGVKRIIKGIRNTSGTKGSISTEAEILKNLDHPSIPRLYDIFEEDDHTFLVEEYIEGESLAELCRHRLLTEKEALSFIIQICSIIQYLHELPEPVLHLDIKPDNIIIRGTRAVLIDFGSALTLSAGQRSRSFNLGFAAPEQEAGLAVDCCTDVYALGQILRFMLDHSSAGGGARDRLGRIASCCCIGKPWKRVSAARTMLKMLKKQEKAETYGKKGYKKDRCVSIGISGMGPGVGTTHIALAAANSLADSGGKRVCLVEKSDHGDLCSLPELQKAAKTEPGTPPESEGVTYYTSGFAAGEAAGALTDKYDYIIYDLGRAAKRNLRILEQCDLEVVVAGAAPWRASKLLPAEAAETGKAAKRIYLINLADGRTMRGLTNRGIRMLPFPFEPDPLHPGRKTKETIERAIR